MACAAGFYFTTPPTIFITRHPTLLRVSILSTILHHSTQYILSRPSKSMPLRVLVSYAPFTDLRPHAFIRRNPHTLFPACGEMFILCGFNKIQQWLLAALPRPRMAACASALRLQAGRRPGLAHQVAHPRQPALSSEHAMCTVQTSKPQVLVLRSQAQILLVVFLGRPSTVTVDGRV